MNEKNGLVFIVDDDRHTRESLSNLIRSAGLSAQTFSSAHQFLTASVRTVLVAWCSMCSCPA